MSHFVFRITEQWNSFASVINRADDLLTHLKLEAVSLSTFVFVVE